MNIVHFNLKNITDFNLDEFWKNLFLVAEKLGFEGNKATILWINDPLPTPEDMHAVCGALGR